MREGGSSTGLGFKAALRFGGSSQLRVVSGLGLGPKRLQAPNLQQGCGLPEGLS